MTFKGLTKRHKKSTHLRCCKTRGVKIVFLPEIMPALPDLGLYQRRDVAFLRTVRIWNKLAKDGLCLFFQLLIGALIEFSWEPTLVIDVREQFFLPADLAEQKLAAIVEILGLF